MRLKSEYKPLLTFAALWFAGIVLMALGILPRFFSFALEAGLIIYLLRLPFEDALGWFIVFLPFSLALPISSHLDTLSVWRINAFVLAFRWAWEGRTRLFLLLKDPKARWLRYLLILGLVSLSWSLIALFASQGALVPGLKTLALYVNAAILIPVIAETIRSESTLRTLMRYGLIALGAVLSIGFLQLLVVFVVPLFNFWQWWATHIIPIFFGRATGELLTYSNTWFSYWPHDIATLRIFSVFQDSHSFALFVILGLVLPLTLWLESRRARWRGGMFVVVCWGILAIILSGTRGSWIGIAGALAGAVLAGVLPKVAPRALVRPTAILTGLLVIALPIASGLWFASVVAQSAQSGQLSETAIFSFQRARSIFNVEETSNKGRLAIWQATLHSIEARPVFGVGAGNFPRVLDQTLTKARQGASAHSLYLQTAAEAGIIGLVAFLAILLYILWYARMVVQQDLSRIYKYLAISFSVIFLWAYGYSVVDVVWLNGRVLAFTAVLLGVLFSFHFLKSYDKKEATT